MEAFIRSRALATLMVVLLITPHGQSFAETPPPPPVTTASGGPTSTGGGSTAAAGGHAQLSEFNAICGDLLKREHALTMAGKTSEATDGQVASQKAQYCAAAQSSIKSYDAHDALWKVWSAVVGVCTAICVASFFGYGSTYICMGVDVAAGIADSVVTSNFQGALMAIGSSAATLGSNWAMRRASAQSGTTAAAVKGAAGIGGKLKAGLTNAEKDIGSCISAAMAGVQVYTNVAGSESDKKMATDTLTAAKKLNMNRVQAFDPNGGTRGPELETKDMGSQALGSAGSAARSGMDSVAGGGFAGGGACGGPGGGPEGGASIMSCAVASDSSLPPWVTSPEFQKEFKDVSGSDLGRFLENATSPNQAIAAASAGSVPEEQATQFAEAVQSLEAGVMAQQDEFLAVNEATYSGGGGGGKNSGSGDGLDKSLTDMMAVMMGTLLPKNETAKKDPKKSASMAAVIFANSRKPASIIPEDKKLNLFDRISYRYFFVSNRVTDSAFPMNPSFGNPGGNPGASPQQRPAAPLFR